MEILAMLAELQSAPKGVDASKVQDGGNHLADKVAEKATHPWLAWGRNDISPGITQTILASALH